ncbi:MAG: hypothetical protein ACOCRK_10770 [bacterium]
MKVRDNGNELEADILKAGYHGSNTSTNENFLEEVVPEIAVIQIGEDRCAHPYPEGLELLGTHDIEIYRKDIHGIL